MIRILGVIPARYASTRFPGKPLAEINGKSMIQRVYEQAKASKSLSEVVVATDDQRIYDHVISFGGKVVMTSVHHATGTDRCAEVVEKADPGVFDVVINIQGDEPYIHPEQIDLLGDQFKRPEVQIATLVKRLEQSSDLMSPTVIKVVRRNDGRALYFSRQALPFLRNVSFDQEWISHFHFYKHIGIYAFRTETLMQVCRIPQGMLEQAESLEQLRWMEHGFDIYTMETSHESHSVDVPEDVLKFTGW